mgnify:FL=1
MDKFKLLKEILGRGYTSGDEQLFFCPYCKHHKKKLSVNVDKNFFKCWICDTSGRSIRRLVRRFGSFQQLQEWDKLSGKTDVSTFDDVFDFKYTPDPLQRISLPDEFATLTGRDYPVSAKHAKSYLENRGVTKEDIVRWKIGYCVRGAYEGRIVVPSFDEEGYVNYFVARAYDNNWRKYMNPSLSKDMVFNHLYIDWSSDVVLTEGVFDAIKAGPNSIPLLGSTLRENSKLFQEIVKNDAAIFVALDPDAEKKSLRMIKNLLTYGIETYKIDVSGYEDVGEMTKEEFSTRKDAAEFVNPDLFMIEQALSRL